MLTTLTSALSLVFKKLPRSLSAGNFWDCLGVGWVMEQEGVSVKIAEVFNGKVLAFGGFEVQLPIFGPTLSYVYKGCPKKGFREVWVDQVDRALFAEPFRNQFFCHEKADQRTASGE